MTTFKDFCLRMKKSAVFENTRIGDFVGDVLSDPSFKEPKTIREFESHLIYRGACIEAKRVGRKVYMLWVEVRNFEKGKVK